MLQKKVFGIVIISLLAITASAVVLQSASAQMQDTIEYNAVYDCGGGKSKFKVMSCSGTGRSDRCDVFYINEQSPGGGFKDTTSRGQIENMLDQGCKTKNGPAVKTKTIVTRGTEAEIKQTPANDKTSGAVACFASDTDANVKDGNERSFRGVLRNFWEKMPEETGPTVTMTFQKMTIGAPRRWRATFDDAYSQADPRKPIYPVRATFTTCTDYTDAITTRKMERIYDCYVHKTGGWQCSQTGASGPLAMKDEKEYIPKKRH